MAVTAAIGAAGLVSGALGARKQAKAQKAASAAAADAARFTPYNVSGLWGNVAFDQANNTVNASMSPQMEQFRSLFGNQAQQYLGGNSPTAGFQQFTQGVGNNMMPGIFGQAMDAAGNLPMDAFAQNQANMGQLSQAAQGLFGTQMGMYGQAVNFANQDVSGLMNDRLNLLRQQAAPYEAQQLASIENSAFARGQLGGPGGRLALSQFGDSLSRADLGRQLAAQDLGLQAQQQNMGMAGLFGNLGSQIGQSGMSNLGFQGDLSQGMFGNALNMSNLNNSRAQQRLQNATGLFGFGNEMALQDYNMGQGFFGNMTNMDDQMRQWIALGGNIGGTQAQAGANQGQFMMQNGGSPGGSFLSSLGTGLMGQAIENMPIGKQPLGYTPGQVG